MKLRSDRICILLQEVELGSVPGLLAKVNSAWDGAKTGWRWGVPLGGRIVRRDPRLDLLQATVSDNLNFVSLRALLYSADGGDLARGLKLFEEMQQKDATLYSVARTRTKALTGLDYEIVSAAEVEDVEERDLADEAASFVREQLVKLDSFGGTLKHLATAIGSNLAVVELVWEGMRLVHMENVPSWRLRQETTEPSVVRVITAEDFKGVPAEGAKWVVHTPESAFGWPMAKALLRAGAFIYLIKMLAIADWAVFCEIYGMPIRIAKYQPGATPEEKTQLIDMMTNLGSKAFGVFSQAVTLEFVESSQRGTAPFKDLIEWCDRTQGKLWLGGNLTADTTGGTGTFAAANVQDEVREDLRDDDIKNEGLTVRRQIIGPMCGARFGREVPLPFFRRVKPETVDRKVEAELIAAAQRIGIKVPLDWALERVGIPKAQEKDKLLTPPDLFEDSLTEGINEGP